MYAFIHIPKTAGTTLRFLFRRSFGARHCDIRTPTHRRKTHPWLEARDLRLVKALYPNLSGICGHRVCSFTDLQQSLPDIKYFTFLRDPVQRFISRFHHQYRGKLDQCTVENLEKFVEDPLHRNMQTLWLCGQENADLAIEKIESDIGMVGLTERFDESLLILKHWLNEPDFEINYVSRNLARGKAPLPYIEDPYIHQLILGANEHDIKVYQHVVEHCFPRQIDEYGDQFKADLSAFQQKQQSFEDVSEPAWGKAKRNLIYKPLLHLPYV